MMDSQPKQIGFSFRGRKTTLFDLVPIALGVILGIETTEAHPAVGLVVALLAGLGVRHLVLEVIAYRRDERRR